MNELEKEKLKKMLGNDLSPEEWKQILEEFGDLSHDAEVLAQRFQEWREQGLAPLSPQFTQEVLSRLSVKGRLSRWWESWTHLPRMVQVTAVALSLLLAVYFVPPLLRGPIPVGVKVIKETTGTGRAKIYQVRFAIRKPGAAEIMLLGDFNEWQGMVLKKDKEDTFHTKLPLSEGTYAYGFLVDGKEWVPDRSAPKVVPDGYGNYNSLINL